MDSDTTEEASAAHLKHERRTSGDFKNGSSNEVNKYTHASIIILGTNVVRRKIRESHLKNNYGFVN